MSEAIISVENLSKRYVIGHQREKGDGLRHVIESAVRHPLQWLRARKQAVSKEHEEFWALKGVSFEVKRGEVVGIIGRNGAGKSTLLKILSRITEPTAGRIHIKGRVASLLEVGTGFHQELTGRENVFLNGAILGMHRAEIKQKFDEIVAFAEVEKFLDTPVKRYSSGMYVRLAFAVAAHLEPEILIVDEVLAVGDAEFQKKCLGKMQSVSTNEGRTVLFVSHNMAAITQLCSRSLNMSFGRVTFAGAVEQGVSNYLHAENHEAVWNLDGNREVPQQTKKVYFTKVELLNADEQPSVELDVRKPFRVRMFYEVPLEIKPVEIAVRILASDGRAVITSLLSDCHEKCLDAPKSGSYVAEVEFPALFLIPGIYSMNVAAHASVGEIYDLLSSVISFTIADTGTRYSKYGHNNMIGVVMRDLLWTDLKSVYNQ